MAFWNVESGHSVVKTGDLGGLFFFSPASDATLLSRAASNLVYQETVELEWINGQVDKASSLDSLLRAAVAVALGDRSDRVHVPPSQF